MKTLAIITIVFLPGTFVATLFATNMIEFESGQEGWIYAVVVIPTTVLIMFAWVSWIKKGHVIQMRNMP
jgi:Mg2+ and Co2+ transporter CorA